MMIGADRGLNDRLDFTLTSIWHWDEVSTTGTGSLLSPTPNEETADEAKGTILGHAQVLLDSEFMLNRPIIIKFDIVPECRCASGVEGGGGGAGEDAAVSPETGPCEMVISFLPAPPEEKIVFMIRHGESRWNEGREKVLAAHQLVGSVDHSLSSTGYMQVRLL